MLIGGVDSGKSTLTRHIIDTVLMKQKSTAVMIETDTGQGYLGAPGVMNAAMITSASTSTERTILGEWESNPSITPLKSWFVGDITPIGSADNIGRGAKSLAGLAKQTEAGKIVVDTCGLVNGNNGIMLKNRLIHMVRPDLLVSLVENELLEKIVQYTPYHRRDGNKIDWPMEILRIAPSPLVIKKTRSMRMKSRMQRFADALQGSALHTFKYRKDSLRYLIGRFYYDQLLLGLFHRHEFKGLGILSGMDYGKRRINILTNVDPMEIDEFMPGGIYINPDGSHKRITFGSPKDSGKIPIVYTQRPNAE